MNKLEEYKINKPQIYTVPKIHHKKAAMQAFSDGYEMGHDAGFDAAIALDLSIKFHEWIRKSCKEGDIRDMENGSYKMDDHFYITEELYKYWIDNIYSPD